MVLFDWQKIYRAAKGKPSLCVKIFCAHATKRIPDSNKDPMSKYATKNFSGGSFLVNPEDFITNLFRYTPKEAAAYLALASLRNLGEYVEYNKTSLDKLHIVVDSEIIKQNRLLYMLNDQLHFIYEEVNSEI